MTEKKYFTVNNIIFVLDEDKNKNDLYVKESEREWDSPLAYDFG